MRENRVAAVGPAGVVEGGVAGERARALLGLENGEVDKGRKLARRMGQNVN